MDPWGIIENVRIPNNPTYLNLFLYHMYEQNCSLENDLFIEFKLQKEGTDFSFGNELIHK